MDAHLEADRCIAILPSVRCGFAAWFVHEDEEKEEYNMKEPCAGEVHQSVGGLMMAGLMLALFIAALDSTVVATALPTISAALGGAAHYAWPMTAYLASSTVSTLLCGGLAFHFGLKRTYAFGLALFAAASALCAVAPTIEALAAFRLLQGIGGGLLEAGVFIAAAMMLPPRDRGSLSWSGVCHVRCGERNRTRDWRGGCPRAVLACHIRCEHSDRDCCVCAIVKQSAR